VIEQTLVKLISMEYLNNVLVIKELYRIFRENCQLSTVVQPQGEFMNVTDQFYPTKRIRNLKLLEINFQLWVLIQQAKEKDLIQVFIDPGNEEQRLKEILANAMCLSQVQNDPGLKKLN
jgi:hypothetical protein